MPRKKSVRKPTRKPKGITPAAKKKLKAKVWEEERRRNQKELHSVRWAAEKKAGQIAVDAYIRKKKWGKYKGKNPYK